VAGWIVWALIVAFEWRLVIVVYAAFYVLVALAVIWLAVLVAVVVAKAVRLARHEQ
jgi:hypothetical protein